MVSHAKVNVTAAKQYHKALMRETGIPFRKIPHGSLDKEFCAHDELSSHQVQVATMLALRGGSTAGEVQPGQIC